MTSTTESANAGDPYPNRLADIVGTAIGLLTLMVPMFVIANYSSNNEPSSQQPITYSLQRRGD